MFGLHSAAKVEVTRDSFFLGEKVAEGRMRGASLIEEDVG
jgi:hypothetical protein